MYPNKFTQWRKGSCYNYILKRFTWSGREMSRPLPDRPKAGRCEVYFLLPLRPQALGLMAIRSQKNMALFDRWSVGNTYLGIADGHLEVSGKHVQCSASHDGLR